MSLKLTEETAQIAAGKNVGNFVTLFDDDRTRITQWVIAPGEQTGWHLHDHDYVSIQQSTGTLHLKSADGSEKTVMYVPGTARTFTATAVSVRYLARSTLASPCGYVSNMAER